MGDSLRELRSAPKGTKAAHSKDPVSMAGAALAVVATEFLEDGLDDVPKDSSESYAVPRPAVSKETQRPAEVRRMPVHLRAVIRKGKGSKSFEPYTVTFRKDRGLVEFTSCSKAGPMGTFEKVVVQPSLKEHSVGNLYKGNKRVGKHFKGSAPSKCPLYGDLSFLTVPEGDGRTYRKTYEFSMLPQNKVQFDRLWSSLLMDNIARTFIDGSTAPAQFKLFQKLWSKYPQKCSTSHGKYGKKW